MGSQAETHNRPCSIDKRTGFRVHQVSAITFGRDRRAFGISLSLGSNWTRQVRLFGVCVEHFPGINFERASARNLFARFAPAPEEEQFKFGTLVFFSNLTHVGVVADEHGFYHASRRHGVIYSEFNEYWLKRIDGFRRVPLPLPVAD
jgi:hypothetical protein